jgi:soluble lytic murein transglycosylase-like protein
MPEPALSEGGFTFKRIGLPDPQSKDKINIQTFGPATLPPPDQGLPEIEEALLPLADPPVDVAEFWAAVSPGLDAQDSRRLQEISALFRYNPELAAQYRASRPVLERIARTWGDEIEAATAGTSVSPALVVAVIGVESAGNVKAVSHAGASGLMQLMPGTAERFGVEDSTDPNENIEGGVAYLDWLLKEFGQDPVLALAGYNAGENAVIRSGGVPLYAETRAYVPKVAAAFDVARGLCLEPPVNAGDDCEFLID